MLACVLRCTGRIRGPCRLVWFGVSGLGLNNKPQHTCTPHIHTGHPRPPAGAGFCAQRLQDRRRPLPRLCARAVRQGRQCVICSSFAWLVGCLLARCCRPLPVDPLTDPFQCTPTNNQNHHRREWLREPREAGGVDGGLLPAHPVVRVPGQRRAQSHHQDAGLDDAVSLTWLGVLRCSM